MLNCCALRRRAINAASWTAVLVVAGILGASMPSQAAWPYGPPDLSRVQVIAVAPFSIAPSAAWGSWWEGWARYGSQRLSALAARGRFQVVPAFRVGEAIAGLGLTPAALQSPTSAVAAGRAVGADAIITSRITNVLTENRDARTMGGLSTRLDVDVRILDVGTRVTLFQDSVICVVSSFPQDAMDCVVYQVLDLLK